MRLTTSAIFAVSVLVGVTVVLLLGPTRVHAADRPRSIFDEDWTPPPRATTDDPTRPEPTAKTRPAPPVERTPPQTQPQTQPDAAPPDGRGTQRGKVRRPVPDGRDQAQVRVVMKEVFAEKLADTSVPARRKLAEELLAQAEKSQDTPAEQFVLLAAAVDAAGDGLDRPGALRAAERMSERFAVDGLAVKADAALRIGPRSGAKNYAAENMEAVIELTDDLIRASSSATAARICAAFAPAGATPELRSRLHQQRRKATAATESAERVAPSAAKLAESPDDPAANDVVGRHICFVLGDWGRGLPMLAKGSDATLKAAAQRELESAKTPDALVRVADGWWDIAAKEADVSARANIAAHAAAIYEGVVDRLSALRKAQIEKRIAEAGAMKPGAAGKTLELLRRMKGKVTGTERGVVFMKPGDRITTPDSYKPPVAFRVVAQTEDRDFRIAYAADQIIFNWANNQSELRIDGGPASGRHRAKAGNVPKKTWVTIDLVVRPESMIVSVDGQERQNVRADFSAVSQPFSIWPSTSPIRVKSVQMTVPPDERKATRR